MHVHCTRKKQTQRKTKSVCVQSCASHKPTRENKPTPCRVGGTGYATAQNKTSIKKKCVQHAKKTRHHYFCTAAHRHRTAATGCPNTKNAPAGYGLQYSPAFSYPLTAGLSDGTHVFKAKKHSTVPPTRHIERGRLPRRKRGVGPSPCSLLFSSHQSPLSRCSGDFWRVVPKCLRQSNLPASQQSRAALSEASSSSHESFSRAGAIGS